MVPTGFTSLPTEQSPAIRADSSMSEEMRVSLPITTVGRLPLSSIRTVPTACPTRKAISAVRFSPTTPRMPSVPNSLPIDITSFVSYDVTVPMGRGFSHAGGWADAPPISLLSCQKRNGPCTVQREKRWRAPVQWPSARRGAADRCKRRFGPAFGHAILFCDFSNCRPVADRAEVVGVVIAWSCFSFRCR